jgi:hypothetical protein
MSPLKHPESVDPKPPVQEELSHPPRISALTQGDSPPGFIAPSILAEHDRRAGGRLAVTRCHACGQYIWSPGARRSKNIFAWTATSVFCWSILLVKAEWSIAWWTSRAQVVAVLALLPVGALYYWLLGGSDPGKTERQP